MVWLTLSVAKRPRSFLKVLQPLLSVGELFFVCGLIHKYLCQRECVCRIEPEYVVCVNGHEGQPVQQCGWFIHFLKTAFLAQRNKTHRAVGMRYLSAGLSLFLTLTIHYQPWTTSQNSKHEVQKAQTCICIRGGCGSGEEPASRYPKVVGSIPPVRMSNCPWAR